MGKKGSGTEGKVWARVCKNCCYRGSADQHAFCTQLEKFVPRKYSCEYFRPLKGRERHDKDGD